MSQPSGFDSAVRGIVMLGVMGGAAWGAMQFPPVRDKVLAWRQDWEKGTLFRRPNDGLEEARKNGGDAPPFSPQSMAGAPGAWDTTRSGGFQPPTQQVAGDWRLEAGGKTNAPAFSNGDGTRSVPATLGEVPRALANHEPPQPLLPPRRPSGVLYKSDPLDADGESLYGAQQTGFLQPPVAPSAPPAAVTLPAGVSLSSAESSPAGTLPAAGQSTAELDAILRGLGANYCLLERWEENPPRYRFHCRVTQGPNMEPKRFEAAGGEPVQVMREVAEAVSAWRTRRGQ